MTYETIIVETRGNVGLITLNRPKALNALNSVLMGELNTALRLFDKDKNIGAMVITGSEKAFAAGADIKEMVGMVYPDTYLDDLITPWEEMSTRRKPMIAAVSGFALGGGCEIAMMCDFILCSETAKFGQPEIKIGVIPGSGGTQRLTRFVGKSKAMEMCLTGRMMNAEEAERSGLVSRIIPVAELVDEAVKVAQQIADYSAVAVLVTKEAVLRSYETTLTEGIKFERRTFQALFGTHGQIEGMAAFAEKRTAKFK